MSQPTVKEKKQEESASYKWVALISVILGAFVAILNQSLINVALPKLVAVFGSTTQDIQWVLTGYMLASAVVIPASGYLGDKYGYKKVLITSLVFFTFGSLLCGLAWSDNSLIAFRVFSGLSGGFIMPISMAIIYMIMPREQVGVALGLWGIAAMVAPAVGPTLSGYIIQYFSWRLLFFISIPVGIFAIIMCSILLKETPKKENMIFDKSGAVLSVVMFGTLLLALSKGQSEGWTSFYIVSLLFTAFFSFLLLLWVELGKEQPLLDFSFFKNPVFSLSTLTSSLVMMGMFGGVFLTPIYLQNIQGLSAIDTGLLMMPQSVAMAIMMPVSGKLFDKYGVVPLGLIGVSIMAVTTYELHKLAVDTPNHWLNVILTIRGIGIGMCMMPLTTAGMNAIPRHLVGKASSLSNVMRQVAGSFGIAILTTIMSQRQTFHGNTISESVPMTSDVGNQVVKSLAALYMQGGIDAGTATGGAAYVLAGLIQREAAARAIGDTFLISAIPLFIAIPLILFFIQRKKKDASDIQSPPANDIKKQESPSLPRERSAEGIIEREPVPVRG